MIRMIAIRPLRYGGKSYRKGEELSVMSKHAGILRAIGQVEDAPPKVDRGVWGDVPASASKLAAVEPVKAKRKYTRRAKVADPTAPLEEPSDEDISRYYRRRDLTAGDY